MKCLAIYLYFTPDLTKCQRDEAFKLPEEQRYRTNELYETNLKISQGCIIKVPEKVVSSIAVGLRLGLRMDFLLCSILRPNILGHILFK